MLPLCSMAHEASCVSLMPEVWVLGKRAANTTADRQQYTNTSKVCDDTMSMGKAQLSDGRDHTRPRQDLVG